MTRSHIGGFDAEIRALCRVLPFYCRFSCRSGADDPNRAGSPYKENDRAAGRLPGAQGLWFGAGLGYGTLETNGSLGGFTGNLEAGWALNRWVSLGAGTSVWTRGMGRLGATVGSFDLRARWYPVRGRVGCSSPGLGSGLHSPLRPAGQRCGTHRPRVPLGAGIRRASGSGVSLTPLGAAPRSTPIRTAIICGPKSGSWVSR